MVRSRPVIAAFAVLAAAACVLPSGSEFSSGSADAGSSASDGGKTDGARVDGALVGPDGAVVTPPAGEAGVDSGTVLDGEAPIVNLLSQNNADFEAGNCDDSGHFQAKLFGIEVAHSGAFACKVCWGSGSSGAAIWSIDNSFPSPPAIGQEYRATAWVRRAPGTTATLTVSLVLRSWTGTYDTVEEQESPYLTLDNDDWKPIATSLALTKAAEKMDTYTFAEHDPGMQGPCFLVDDYVVWRTK